MSSPSPDLFIREDGQPMAFMMGHTGYESQVVKALVEEGGGVVLSRPTLMYREFLIRLLVRTEIPIKMDQDMYNYKYALDCVEKNEILANLNDYKVISSLPSIFEPYNALDILQGMLKWSDVPRKQLGERVSDIEYDQDPEFEQPLDQSVVPLHLEDNFPSSGSEDDPRVIRDKTHKKRKLSSWTFLDSVAEESDIFAVSPIKKSRGTATLEIIQGIDGCVTSTQKGHHSSPSPVDYEKVPVINGVFDSAEFNLAISENSGSAFKERANPRPQTTATASIHHSPSGSNPNQANHEGRSSPSSSHLSESQNLLAPEPCLDVISKAVTNLEDIPVVEAEKENTDGGEIIEEPVDTQGLANAITSIGEHDPGPEPGPSREICTSSPSRSSRRDVNNFPSNNILVHGIRPHPPGPPGPPIPSQSSSQTTPLPTLRKGKRRVSTISVTQDKNKNEKEDESNYDIFDYSDSEHNHNLLERSARPTAPPKTGGSKVPRSGPYWASDNMRGEGKGKVQKGNKIAKGVEAHVGFTKGGELHMVLGNLPCDPEDIDSEDIELVRTGRKGHRKNVRMFSTDSDESVDIVDVSNSDENDVVRRVKKGVDVLNPEPGPSRRNYERKDENGQSKRNKLKLKLITTVEKKEHLKGNERKRGRFVREGEFDDKFRLPYTKREEEAIVNYLLEEGGYKLRRGNRIWERMEEKGICPGRIYVAVDGGQRSLAWQVLA